MNRTATDKCLIRKAYVEDGKAIWKLVVDSGNLDVNSAYCYIMLCEYFGDTCLVAEMDGEIVGFVSAFLQQEDPEVLFVWQIAVLEAYRGRRIAESLLHELITSKPCEHVRYVKTTITPSNKPSQRLFAKFAERMQTAKVTLEGFTPHLFPSKAHEGESLIRIGPLEFNKHIYGRDAE